MAFSLQLQKWVRAERASSPHRCPHRELASSVKKVDHRLQQRGRRPASGVSSAAAASATSTEASPFCWREEVILLCYIHTKSHDNESSLCVSLRRRRFTCHVKEPSAWPKSTVIVFNKRTTRKTININNIRPGFDMKMGGRGTESYIQVHMKWNDIRIAVSVRKARSHRKLTLCWQGRVGRSGMVSWPSFWNPNLTIRKR